MLFVCSWPPEEKNEVKCLATTCNCQSYAVTWQIQTMSDSAFAKLFGFCYRRHHITSFSTTFLELSSFSGSFWRPLTFDFDNLHWKLTARRLHLPWETFASISVRQIICLSIIIIIHICPFFSRPYLNNGWAICLVVVRLSVRPSVCRWSRMHCG